MRRVVLIFDAFLVGFVELCIDFFFRQRTIRFDFVFVAFRVEENDVGVVSPTLRRMMRAFLVRRRSFPSDFIPKIIHPKHGVHH